MDGFRIDPDALETPSTQIVAGVLDALCAGRLTTGDQLPSVRALAAHLGVNTNTVGRAYAELERLDVVEGRRGSGVYVSSRGALRASRIRRRATLRAFERASNVALRAGHPPSVLVDTLERLTALEPTSSDSARSQGRT